MGTSWAALAPMVDDDMPTSWQESLLPIFLVPAALVALVVAGRGLVRALRWVYGRGRWEANLASITRLGTPRHWARPPVWFDADEKRAFGSAVERSLESGRWLIRYEYVHQGRLETGESIYEHTTMPTIGDPLTVYVDPRRPQRSVFVGQSNLRVAVILYGCAVAGALLLAHLAYLSWSRVFGWQ